MSHRLDWSRLPVPQPSHKVCDVTCNPRHKKRSGPRGAEPPDVSIRPPDAPPAAEETAAMDGLLQNCRIKNQLLRECLAEFLGVYVLIVSKEEDAEASVKPLDAADDP